MKQAIAALALVMLFSCVATAQDADTVIANASRAMGADGLKSIEYSATGADFALGQAYSPGSRWPMFIEKAYTRAIDFERPASRVVRVRRQGENPPHGGAQPLVGEQTQTQITIIDANTPWVQQLDIWMMPHAFLRAAMANRATVKSQTVGGKKYAVVTFMGQNKAPVNGYINDQNMVDKVETWIDNPMLGDMLVEALYTDYRDFGSVKFPTRIVQKQGGFATLDLAVSDVTPNAPLNIPPVQGSGAAQAPGAISEKFADGVYVIFGAYTAMAVDFKDYIVVIEGPESETRANAVIAEAKRLIPNKPIKYVVNTHHHFDHAGGLRTFVAEGAIIVTHEINKPYYEKLFSLPHTLASDRLADVKTKPKFETMTEKKVLTDGNRVIELYHLQGSGHSEGLLVAYFPKDKILVVADAFNPPQRVDAPPPNPPNPYTVNLVANLERLKLDVQTIVAIHYPADGRRVSGMELMRAVGPRH